MEIRAEDHLGLVRKVVLKYIVPGVKLDDTEEYSDGLIGLFHAIEKFNTEKDIEFSTFAFCCIKNAVIQGIRQRKKQKQNDGNTCSLDFDYAIPDKIDYFSVVDHIFANHEDDSPTDTRNKRMLYENYILGKTWDAIGEEFGFTRAFAWQCGESAILLLKTRFANALAQFGTIDTIL